MLVAKICADGRGDDLPGACRSLDALESAMHIHGETLINHKVNNKGINPRELLGCKVFFAGIVSIGGVICCLNQYCIQMQDNTFKS